ncbi:MAG: alpha/beta fold hydrolase [Bacilli bacterium]
MEQLYYRTYGEPSNPPVVLVHGVGGSMTIFFRQIQQFKKHFYVIALDLPGHGNSYKWQADKPLTFEAAARSIADLLEHLHIRRAMFVGVSLGTVVIHELMRIRPDMVKRAVLAGAITSINFSSNMLLKAGGVAKEIMPYMWLYGLCARVIMPKANHKQSRQLFIQEAKKMGHDQFVLWYRLSSVVNGLYEKSKNLGIRKMYITGKQDHFLYRAVQKDTADDNDAQFVPLDQCGHVCNVDQAATFNRLSISFFAEEDKIDCDDALSM